MNNVQGNRNLRILNECAEGFPSRVAKEMTSVLKGIAQFSDKYAAEHKDKYGELAPAEWEQARQTLESLRKVGEGLAEAKGLIDSVMNSVEGVARPKEDPSASHLQRAIETDLRSRAEKLFGIVS